VAGQPVSDQEVMKGFAHLHERARNIIRHGKNWKLWVLCDATRRALDRRPRRAAWRCRPPDAAIFRARRLPGDGNAVCLSHMLGSHPDDFVTALEKLPRAAFSPHRARELLSRAIGEHIYHPAGEHARLRNAIMSAKSSETGYRDLAWLYGGRGGG